MKEIKPLFLFILLTGIIVRVAGIHFGLPFVYHNDESVVVNYALAYGCGDFNPHFFNVPPLLTYILFFAYGIFYAAGRLFGVFSGIEDFGFLFLNNPTCFYLIGRFLLGAIPGVFSIYLIYELGRKSFSESVGLLSALFLSLNFLHVRNSHYIYFDTVLIAAVIYYLIVLLGLFKTEKLRFYFYGGMVLAIALSTKYSAVVLIFPTALIILLNMLWLKRYSFGIFLKKAAVFVSSLLLFLFLTNPFMFLDFSDFCEKIFKIQSLLFRLGFWFHLKVTILGSLGIFMLLAALSGMILAIVKRKVFAIVLIFYTLAYYFVLTRASQASARYIAPILPVFLVFAAFFVDSIANRIKGKNARLVLISFLSSVLLFYSCLKIYYCDKLFLKTDTRTQAYEWIISNIPPGKKIALDATGSVYPTLKRTKQQIQEGLRDYDYTRRKFEKPKGALDYKIRLVLENPEYGRPSYQLYYIKPKVGRHIFFGTYPEIPVGMDFLKSNGIEYLVLNKILQRQEKHRAFIANLEKDAVLLKEFSPYKRGIQRLKPEELTDEPAAAFSFIELKDRERFGPVLRIYKLTKL